MSNVVDELINSIYRSARENRAGEVASYIPELAATPPDSFGICVATVDGYVYEYGDSRTPFTIQSISKPFTYALAIADQGLDAVANKIDVEPSGEPFNEISLDPHTEHPRNPMINAGAITSASLVAGADITERYERIRAMYSDFAGRELTLNESVYKSESRTGNRNRAIGYMLREFDIITEHPENVLDLYFRQCSIDVTCHDLSLMAATLANNGTNPVTGKGVARADLVEHVLSVMATCGMYDEAGAWLTEVGLPAKSGVGGGIIAVLPGQIGIAVYSPRLDQHGNSVRGVQTCRELSRKLELHFLHVTRASRSSIRAQYALAESPSRMRRTEAERTLLDKVGACGRVYELHGDLLFAGAEIAVREMSNAGTPPIKTSAEDSTEAGIETMVIDVRRVDDLSPVAAKMLTAARVDLVANGVAVAVVDPEGVLTAGVDTADTSRDYQQFADLDTALQWCEDILLDRHGMANRPNEIALHDHPIVVAFGTQQRERIVPLLKTVHFQQGDLIVAAGSPASGLHLVLKGRISSTLTDARGIEHRIVTLTAGTSFGEMPLLLHTSWMNDFRADTDVAVAVLTPEDFSAIAAEYPAVEIALLKHLAVRSHEHVETLVRAAKRTGTGPLRQ